MSESKEANLKAAEAVPPSVMEAIALHAETLNTTEDAQRFYAELRELANERCEVLEEMAERHAAIDQSQALGGAQP